MYNIFNKMHSVVFGCIPLIALNCLSGCQSETSPDFLGSAVVEADSWKVGLQNSGPILFINTREGDLVHQGDLIALTDTTPLFLKIKELDAARYELTANIAARKADVKIQEAKQEGTVREWKRASALQAEGAIPSRQQDEWQSQVQIGNAQLQALQLAVQAQISRLRSLDAQRTSLQDQLNRCKVISPTNGRVSARYRNEGELAIPGKPLLEILREDTVTVDFFVPQPLLAQFLLGQILQVRVDTDSQAQWMPGKLTWIASEAEFTPKSIQTREARNSLVYRLRLRVANPQGTLKRGQPVEVWKKMEI